MNVCKTHSLCSQTPVSQASRQWKWNPSVVSDSWRPHGLQPKRLLCPWDFPGENTGVDCHFLLQEIFPTKRIKPGSPALWADALPSEPPGWSRQFLVLFRLISPPSLNGSWVSNWPSIHKTGLRNHLLRARLGKSPYPWCCPEAVDTGRSTENIRSLVPGH